MQQVSPTDFPIELMQVFLYRQHAQYLSLPSASGLGMKVIENDYLLLRLLQSLSCFLQAKSTGHFIEGFLYLRRYLQNPAPIMTKQSESSWGAAAATRSPCAALISRNGATLLHFDKCSCDNEEHHLGEVIQSFCLVFFSAPNVKGPLLQPH